METLEAPKHPTAFGCHHPSTAARFGLDDRRRPAEVHQETRCSRRARTRTSPSCFNRPTLTLVSSSPTSQRASATSTLVMLFTEISKGHVITPVLSCYPIDIPQGQHTCGHYRKLPSRAHCVFRRPCHHQNPGFQTIFSA